MSQDNRPFGIWTAAALVVGSMIGAGIFVLPGQLAPFGWTGFAAWIAAGLGAMAIALVIADLTATMPEEPGLIAICGRVIGPLAGVLLGWSYWISLWCATAVVATTAASYLGALWPGLSETPLRTALAGSLIVLSITALNLRGARAAGQFQVATTVLKLLPLIAVVVILGGLVFAGGGQFSVDRHPPFASAQLTPALTLAFFAILSFETASMVTERVRDPARNVVRATLIGLAATIVLYVVVCMGIILALPTEALGASSAPVAYFVERFWGLWAGSAVALLTAVSGIGYVNSAVLLQGELPLTAVRGGMLPGWIAPTNRHDVAVAPMTLGSLFSVLLMIGGATGIGAKLLDFMLRLTTAAAIWIYIGVAVSALMLGRRQIMAAISIGFSLWVLYGAGLEAGGLGIVLILLGFPLYLATRRFSSAAAS
ncbi:amino acid permease [Novosphingobium sp. APW14]|uniref:APC family permease n=1 Tax=Novosphingobium sp. APW14 TaxID=3077237 RepID=UPI0028DE1395|nr:amino acid permease [Novosphingobium sp. APW14]MDT9012543.1 amino acid permease [Novosphingobium sp. APW14]